MCLQAPPLSEKCVDSISSIGVLETAKYVGGCSRCRVSGAARHTPHACRRPIKYSVYLEGEAVGCTEFNVTSTVDPFGGAKKKRKQHYLQVTSAGSLPQGSPLAWPSSPSSQPREV